jgi:hypothetical protein
MFHQFTDGRTVFGFNFYSVEDANAFSEAMNIALKEPVAAPLPPAPTLAPAPMGRTASYANEVPSGPAVYAKPVPSQSQYGGNISNNNNNNDHGPPSNPQSGLKKAPSSAPAPPPMPTAADLNKFSSKPGIYERPLQARSDVDSENF